MPQTAIIHDLHIHTEFSPDSTAPLKLYAEVAHQLGIHIGFLDHMELAFLTRPGYLNYENLPHLLEAFDQIHTHYPHTSIGLEVDFYSDLSSTVAEFCDEYQSEFDYFIGAVHTIERLAVTNSEEMNELVKQLGLQEVIERYYYEVEAAIQSKLFQGIAHIDGVMRFFPQYLESKKLEPFWEQRTLDLGLLCKKQNLLVEVNMHGVHYPWAKTHPSQLIIDKLVKAGTKFYIGSDSHNLDDFQITVPQIRRMNKFLAQHNALAFPRSLSH